MTTIQWLITLLVTGGVPTLTWLALGSRWSGRMDTRIDLLSKQTENNGLALKDMQNGMVTQDRLENVVLKMQSELREAFGREYATVREVAKLEARLEVLHVTQKRDPA